MEAMLNVDLQQVARDVGLPLEKVQSTVELLDEGNTVPFITRFRKDQSGGLNEDQIRQVQESVKKYRALADRKQRILKSLESQEKLSESLAARINSADSLHRLEDLYQPFKPKKQTLAAVARSRGLEQFSHEILMAAPAAADLQARAGEFVNPENGLPTTAEVLQGAGHIIAELLSEDLPLRDELRALIEKNGKLVSTRIEEPREQPQPAGQTSPDSETDESQVDPSETQPAETVTTVTTVAHRQAPSVETTVPTDSHAALHAVSEPAAEEPAAEEPAAEEPAAEEPAAEEPAAEEPAAEEPAESELAESVSTTDQPAASPADIDQPVAAEAQESESVGASQSPQTPTADAASGEKSTDQAAPAPKKSEAKPTGGKSKPKPTVKQLAAKTRKEAKKRKRQKKVESFKDYFKYQEPLAKVPPHRLLAINRGDRSKILRVKIDVDMAQIAKRADQIMFRPDHPHREYLRGCLRDALTRLIFPSLEREIRRELTERAESHAVRVFARNLRQLLLQPPVRDRRVLAIDPGFRSGCKLAAIDEFGNVLGHTVIHVIGKADIVRRGRQQMLEMITMYHIPILAIGNGTGCRETERMVADILANELRERDVQYVIVNEAGASVYSTSPLGREELPKFDPVLRSAISIGRRLQDPLSELVKINPANIGVGLYQHDVKAKHLEESLDAVVESCVNFVGVDVNTASPSLLRYVSGLNQLTARRLYEYRQQHGPFRNRNDFKKVPGFGDATFVQAAGFLKIIGGDNPLDATWIHPESYEVAEQLIANLGGDKSDLATGQPSTLESRVAKRSKRKFGDGVANTGEPTVAGAAPASESTPEPAGDEPQPADEVAPAADSEPASDVTATELPDADTPVSVEPAGDKDEASAAPEELPEAGQLTAEPPVVAASTEETSSPAPQSEQTPAAEAATEEALPQEEPPAEEPPAEEPPAEEPSLHEKSPTQEAVDETPATQEAGADAVVASPQQAEDTAGEAKSTVPLAERAAKADVEPLTAELGVGKLLLHDILGSLTRPGRDPREDLPPPAFRREIIKLEHLQPGMELTGTALNVVDFGAFVDIGLPDSGLIHISRLADRFIKDPHEVVSVGDILTVWVVEVDKQRRRVSLTAIKPGTEKPPEVRKERSEGRPEQERKRAGKRDERRGEGRRSRPPRSDRPSTHTVSKPPAPARPITEKMVKGKEPMRSFSDLLQFHEKKSDKKKSADQNKDKDKDKDQGSGEGEKKS